MRKLMTMTAMTLTMVAYSMGAFANMQTQNDTHVLASANPNWSVETRSGLTTDSSDYLGKDTHNRIRKPLLNSTGMNGNYGVVADENGSVTAHDRMSTHDIYSSTGGSATYRTAQNDERMGSRNEVVYSHTGNMNTNSRMNNMPVTNSDNTQAGVRSGAVITR